MAPIANLLLGSLLASHAHGGRLQSRKVSLTCGAKGVSGSASQQHNETGINIVNGQPAKECAWKWQVGLRSSIISAPFCGGMLVDKDWVLTAAHCLDGSGVNVVAGKYNLYWRDAGEQNRNSKRIIKHPYYGRFGVPGYDIALIQLESPMEMTDCVGKVCLPSEGSDIAPGSKCAITGWGTLESGGLWQPRRLQEGEVTVMSNEDCRRTGYRVGQITDDMLCAQGRNADGAIVDACQGDSGGPLVCEDASAAWTVYGATSWGRGCAGENYPGVWARVHHFLDWIAETMEKYS